MFRCREGQEKDMLDKVRSIWCLLGTFTVQLMGSVLHIPASKDVVHDQQLGKQQYLLMIS